jgi:thioredoxin reductase
VLVDLLVVGGGPAGLAAATWAARHRRSVLLCDSGEQRNRWVSESHGYLGSDAIDPAQLRARALTDLERYATCRVEAATVLSLEQVAGTFVATTDVLGEVQALRVVLAVGVVDEFPRIDGFFDHYGSSVFHCPTCDGYEVRGQHVVAIGWSEQLAGFALTLLDWAGSVTLVTDGRELDIDDHCHDALRDHGVVVRQAEIARFVGARGALEGVELVTGEVLPCERAFFSVAHTPRSTLVSELGLETDGDCVVVDEHMQTSVPGVYAAGDMTPGMQLVQVAAAEGAVAGIAAAMSLRPRPGPDVEETLATG